MGGAGGRVALSVFRINERVGRFPTANNRPSRSKSNLIIGELTSSRFPFVRFWVPGLFLLRQRPGLYTDFCFYEDTPTSRVEGTSSKPKKQMRGRPDRIPSARVKAHNEKPEYAFGYT